MSLLDAREATHGDAWTTALAYNLDPLAYPYHMIRAKLARIESGDAMHEDHWRDIEGYAQMALGFIEKMKR